MNASMVERLRIWQENQAVGLLMLSKASTHQNVALLVCDTADEIGGPLSQTIAEKAGSAESMAEHQKKILAAGHIQTALSVVPVGLLASVLVISTPSIAETLRRTPPQAGAIYVVVIAAGGTTLLQVARPAKAKAVHLA
jgi:hypothetical protein